MFAQCPGRGMRSAGLGGGFLILLMLGFSSLWFGSRTIPPAVIWQALTQFDPQNSAHLLVWHLRLPRTLLAMVVGAALGGAGVIMQTLTRNPLADPGLLGVNAGATLAIVLSIAFLNVTSVSSYMIFGVAGAGVISILVFMMGGLNHANPIRIVLAGAALTIVLLSLTQLVILNSDADAFDRFRHWVTGALQGRGMTCCCRSRYLRVSALFWRWREGECWTWRRWDWTQDAHLALIRMCSQGALPRSSSFWRVRPRQRPDRSALSVSPRPILHGLLSARDTVCCCRGR